MMVATDFPDNISLDEIKAIIRELLKYDVVGALFDSDFEDDCEYAKYGYDSGGAIERLEAFINS